MDLICKKELAKTAKRWGKRELVQFNNFEKEKLIEIVKNDQNLIFLQ